jgi:non-ribosomal peptide synthetase-like protein
MTSTTELRTRPTGLGLSVLARGDPPLARTLIDVFETSVAAWANNVALEDSERRLTYAELDGAARDLAARLAAAGIGRGARVGVRLPSGVVDLYVAILGVLMTGAAYVPAEFSDPEARAELMWSEVGAAAVVQEELAISLRSPGEDRIRGHRSERPRPVDDAWIIFTSGSTGIPKAVAVPHRSAAALVDAEAALFAVQPTDRVQGALSVAFDASCEEMWLAWRNGATLVATPRAALLSVDGGADAIRERGITVVSTVPSLAALWPASTWNDLRIVILGGDACTPALAAKAARSAEVWNTYGPTEATVVTTAARLGSGPVTIGAPLPGWEVAVVDADGDPVPAGDVGELVIAGVGLGRYLDPALDAERFRSLPSTGWNRAYRTGDRVRVVDAELEFVGRNDEQVKINGRRVELGEIDAQLAHLPGVVAAACAVQTTAAGNPVLVGYVVGDVDLQAARAALATRLPHGLVPRLTVVTDIPRSTSGKIARGALPWPIVERGDGDCVGDDTSAWVLESVRDPLGPVTVGADTDFFELGGNSLMAAKLVSAFRTRYPAVGTADLYAHRPLRAFIEWLAEQPVPRPTPVAADAKRQRRRPLELLGVAALFLLAAPQLVVPMFVFGSVVGSSWAPTVPLVYLVVAWLVFMSLPGRALIVAALKKLLIGRVEPGRYPRGGRVHLGIWFLERLSEIFSLDALNGTPWAVRHARLLGADVGTDVRLGSAPPVTGLLTIGAGSSVGAEVEIMDWCFQGDEIVIGAVAIGCEARVGTRSCLLPGAQVRDRAEIEPGTCVSGEVPSGERWAGSPARRVAIPDDNPTAGSVAVATSRWQHRFWEAIFGLATLLLPLLAVIAAAPSLLVLLHLERTSVSAGQALWRTLMWSPLLVTLFFALYAVLAIVTVRLLSHRIEPGTHPEPGRRGFALWLNGQILDSTRTMLFPLYGSIFTPLWLRALGAHVGRNTEISTPVGIPALLTVKDGAFVADDVRFATPTSWQGWLSIDHVTVGERAFVGNGATLDMGTTIGEDALIAVASRAPGNAPPRSSWLGSPPLEFPRTVQSGPLAKTYAPSTLLKVARAAIEATRGLIGYLVWVMLVAGAVVAIDASAHAFGLISGILVAPLALAGAGLAAWGVTAATKWTIAGRYRVATHPLWSLPVWRTEFVDAIHEQVAGSWLTPYIIGTGVFSLYLRSMGARVGSDVWCETASLTEFDLLELGDGVQVSKQSDVQTHLFHDRMMQTGPVWIGPGATIGVRTVVLPETVIGSGVDVGPRSLVMRGEQLASGTAWQGVPVVGR